MELKNKGIIIRIFIKLCFFVLLQYLLISCKLNLTTNPGEIIFLMNDIRKLGLIISSSEANITISGTLKDSAGNIIPGGILEISRLGSTNIMAKATADSKVYADINGKFSMNIFADSFNIKVSRSDGSFVGSFALKVTSATDPPEVLTSTGLQVSGLAASPSSGGTIIEPLKVALTGLPQVINEGQSVTVQVKLSRVTTSNLTVNLSLNNSAITIDGTSSKSLSFSADNSTTNQSITLAAVGDTNIISETVVLTIKADGIDDTSYSLTALDTTVSAPVISISNAPSNINEGNSISIGIKLTGNVTQSYTLSVSSSKPNSISVSPSTLTFTTANFSVDQQVTLTALQDENLVSESVTIILAATGLNQVSFSVNATDDDTQNILISGANSLNEGGNGSISVRLSKEPPSNVTVNLSSSNTTSLSLGSSVLTFTPSNYSTNQTVAVNALQDDNQNSETVVITTTATGVSSGAWNIVCIDDDTTIVFSGNNSVNEGGSITLGVTLSGNPGTSRTVSFSSGNTNSITVSPSSMIFTSNNYGTSQALTVTGVEDANVIAESITIAASSTGLVSSSKAVNTVDNDTMNITLGGATTVNEGSTASMTVILTQDPSGNLTVNLSSGNPAISVSPASLTFTSANYSTIQNVTLTGVEDSNESSETVTISSSATGVTPQTRSVVAIDNDIRPVFSGASSVNEGGTASISITLSGNPGTSRTVNLSSNNVSSVTLTPTELTFTSANWNSAQTVNLTGVQDLNALGESVTLTASGTGLVTETKSITVVDDETQSIVLAGSGSTITEGTSSVTFSVKLAYDPVNTYQVNLASSNTGSVSLSPSTLTFTSANFSTNQTVTLTGVEDVNQTSESITITASGTGVSNQTLSYTTIENDTTIVFGTPSGYEGSTVTVPITLSGNPGVSRTVSFSSSTTPPTISSGTLSFTTSNFNTPQNLTLSGVTDTTTSIITASGSGLIASNWNAITAKYAIGGSVSGLTGNLVLTNKNSYDTVTISGNGNFNFPKTASTYAVVAKLYLLGKVCVLSNLTGIASTIVNNIGINCTNINYTIGEGGLGILATGQIISYATGDDGTYQSTLKRSFTDNEDGTVIDNITGLIFQKCSAGQGSIDCTTGTATTYTYSSANSYCSSLNISNKSWRLPTVNELISLIDYSKSSGARINTAVFINSMNRNYWSSTGSAQNSTRAWYVSFNDGSASTVSKTSSYSVRCISGSQTSRTFQDNTNGTITDLGTGLIWQKCTAGQEILDCNVGTSSLYTWTGAVNYCNSLNLLGKKWRLPSINEIRSLVDYSKSSSPTILNTTDFSNTQSLYYWSSNTVADNTSNAWDIIFTSGSVTNDPKSNSNYVRCVTGP